MNIEEMQRQVEIALGGGEFETALDICNQFITENPNLAEGFRRRAGVYAKLNSFAEAISDIDRAIATSPSNASYYFFRGWWHLEVGEVENAELDQTSAIRLDGEGDTATVRESAYFFRAMARLEMGRSHQALLDLENVREDFLIFTKRHGKVTKAELIAQI